MVAATVQGPSGVDGPNSTSARRKRSHGPWPTFPTEHPSPNGGEPDCWLNPEWAGAPPFPWDGPGKAPHGGAGLETPAGDNRASKTPKAERRRFPREIDPGVASTPRSTELCTTASPGVRTPNSQLLACSNRLELFSSLAQA